MSGGFRAHEANGDRSLIMSEGFRAYEGNATGFVIMIADAAIAWGSRRQ